MLLIFIISDGGWIPPPNIKIEEPSQYAVVKWDEGKETIVFAVDVYSSSDTSLLWIIPVPSTPSVDSFSRSIFYQLRSYSMPLLRKREIGCGDGWYSPYDVLGGRGEAYKDYVEEIASGTIGPVEYMVIRAEDEDTLIRYLNSQGFSASEYREECIFYNSCILYKKEER